MIHEIVSHPDTPPHPPRIFQRTLVFTPEGNATIKLRSDDAEELLLLHLGRPPKEKPIVLIPHLYLPVIVSCAPSHPFLQQLPQTDEETLNDVFYVAATPFEWILPEIQYSAVDPEGNAIIPKPFIDMLKLNDSNAQVVSIVYNRWASIMPAAYFRHYRAGILAAFQKPMQEFLTMNQIDILRLGAQNPQTSLPAATNPLDFLVPANNP